MENKSLSPAIGYVRDDKNETT